MLALAQMPSGPGSVADDGVRGHLIPHTPGTVIADEEAPVGGICLRRRARLSVGSGDRRLWHARITTPGRGEASSGLRFDILTGPRTRR
jgi:hypothetical protein